MATKQHFIGQVRDRINNLLDAVEDLESLRNQYQSLDYATDLADSDFETVIDDTTGEVISRSGHEDISLTEFKAAIASFAALLNFLEAQGHFEDLYRMRN